MRFARNHWPQKGNTFVIMPFGKKQLQDGKEFDWDEHYDQVIKPTVEEAGMTSIRADEIYGSKPLMERVWRGIQEAEIVLADLTGRSPNVMYEVGLAHVIGKRILILTMFSEDVPVDLSEFVQIRYSNVGVQLLQFTRELIKNIKAAKNEPAAEAMLSPLPGAGLECVSATVQSVTASFATVETQDGRRGFLSADDFSWVRRKPDLTRLLKSGQKVDGAFIVDVKGQQLYSLTAVEDNPWPKLENEFRIGTSFRGIVHNHPVGIGAFITVKYGINGLIPESQIPAGISLSEGSQVEAVVFRINSQAREVELRFSKELEGDQNDKTWGPYNAGDRFPGTFARLVPEHGYSLVRLPNGNTGLLHFRKMSHGLRERFDDRKIALGESVHVELVQVDQVRKKLFLADVPSEGAQATEATTVGKGA